ncbi:multicopper oxidase family protein [Streptomyces sp. ISL-43]|uniref:multicopper oxidase family protein n=1 Tax=Streptomyces sp. ISL-43 TaxID=2819183 RepID=UPI001BECC7EB|nr:multicopper oxidase family protein [Streptomyces sp. ISL-43]MBT2447868.1 multicopper oxidase family protein [Streptomyces sp. ISL-43]
MLTRRQLIKAGAATGLIAAAAPAGVALAGTTAPAGAESLFAVPLRIPKVLRPSGRSQGRGGERGGYDVYRLTTREVEKTVIPGTTTKMRTFNGELMPVIRATRGRPVVIEQVNALDVPFSMHLHGGHVPASSDGHPNNQVSPGGNRVFYYPNTQRASTMWMHDHSHEAHAENIYRGLAASYILTDDFEERLPLPKGQYDVPLHLRDAQFAEDGTLVYDPEGFMKRPTILVNGAPRPFFEVAARKYRFRLANTSNERAFLLQLGEGDEMTHIGSDGGLLPAPVSARVLEIWPAERQEIVIDFSRYPVGSKIVLRNLIGFAGEPAEVMRFDVVRRAADPSRVPDTLRAVPDIGTPTVERKFVMNFDPATGHHLINGLHFDINRVDLRPKVGVTELWTVENTDVRFGIPHSMHTHLEHFQVVERDGAAPGPGEAGLKDTVTVMPGKTVKFKIKFTDYTGLFMFHCHLMGHLNMGMMGQMAVEN